VVEDLTNDLNDIHNCHASGKLFNAELKECVAVFTANR